MLEVVIVLLGERVVISLKVPKLVENYQSNWCLLLLQVEICYQNVFRELFANRETE